jgi:hypothetical protein
MKGSFRRIGLRVDVVVDGFEIAAHEIASFRVQMPFSWGA